MSKKEKIYNIGRVPVVAVMGHVDHGKTTFLDNIRGTKVQEGEVGGITQNTRAHEVDFNGQKITFIDTPGHEAFSSMRSRGAQVTDIVLLVVAADDGIQPQTKESIEFAKEAGVPIIVAINKIDLPGIDLNKIKSQLSQNDLLIEEYGGDVQVFEISAIKKQGLDELLDGILLQVEILELKPNKTEIGKSNAIVLESKLDKNLGAVALVLMKSASVKVGDVAVAVSADNVTQVRAVMDEYQNNIEEGLESMPVWLVGLREVLPTGEVLYFAENEKEGKEILKKIKDGVVDNSSDEEEGEEEQDDLLMLASLVASEQKDEEIKKLNIVIKTDTQGTLEVVLNELESLNDEEVQVNVLSSGTGDITRKDILTAKNAKGIVLGFQVIVPSDLDKIVSQEKVLVRVYSVIYDLIDEVGDVMDAMLEPEQVEEVVARARVKLPFKLSNGDIVAGSVVEKGTVIKGYKVWVERDGEEVGRGKITSLKKLKDEVKEVQKGSECGILIEPKMEILEGDNIVLYKMVSN